MAVGSLALEMMMRIDQTSAYEFSLHVSTEELETIRDALVMQRSTPDVIALRSPIRETLANARPSK